MRQAYTIKSFHPLLRYWTYRKTKKQNTSSILYVQTCILIKSFVVFLNHCTECPSATFSWTCCLCICLQAHLFACVFLSLFAHDILISLCYLGFTVRVVSVCLSINTLFYHFSFSAGIAVDSIPYWPGDDLTRKHYE